MNCPAPPPGLKFTRTYILLVFPHSVTQIWVASETDTKINRATKGRWYYQLHKRQTQLPRIFKLKGWVITFPPDQSERPPGLSTNGIEAVSRRLSKAEFQPARAQATQAGLSSVNWPGQNKLGIPDLNWKWKFLATVFGVYAIGNIISL